MAKILIVNDASFTRNILQKIVESVGHEVVGLAEDGVEAIRIYKELKPDIVTMDIMMAGIDGFEALSAIKDEEPEAKVIMVTALGQKEKQEQARELGATGYIIKPFKANEIIKEIDRVMGMG